MFVVPYHWLPVIFPTFCFEFLSSGLAVRFHIDSLVTCSLLVFAMWSTGAKADMHNYGFACLFSLLCGFCRGVFLTSPLIGTLALVLVNPLSLLYSMLRQTVSHVCYT